MAVEDDLVSSLSKVLLNDETTEPVEGLDDDLVAYIAGMLASRVDEQGHSNNDDNDESQNEIVTEVLLPFLESVACPEDLVTQAQEAVMQVLQQHAEQQAQKALADAGGARKLRQGVVSMSSDLDPEQQASHEQEANRFLWGTDNIKVRANAPLNHRSSSGVGSSTDEDPISQRDKRKARRVQAEKMRKALSSSHDYDADQGENDPNKSNHNMLVRMKYNLTAGDIPDSSTGGVDKKKDVNVKNVTVSLDNGTVLLESGELKFAYQRRYGLIGENGVGKSVRRKALCEVACVGLSHHHVLLINIFVTLLFDIPLLDAAQSDCVAR